LIFLVKSLRNDVNDCMATHQFKEKLAQIMSDRRLSISELAKKSGIHYTMISNYLKADRRGRLPTLNTLVALASALHCSLEQLTGIDLPGEVGKDPELTKETLEFAEAYESLSDEQKDLIDRMIDTLSDKQKSESHDKREES